MRYVRVTVRAVLALFVIVSLALNVAVFTVSGVFGAVSGALGTLGVATALTKDAADRRAKRAVRKKLTRDITRQISRRAVRRVTRNAATSVMEALPLVGAAVIGGTLILEVVDACETGRQMAGLEAAMITDDDPEHAQLEATANFDCRDLIVDNPEQTSKAADQAEPNGL